MKRLLWKLAFPLTLAAGLALSTRAAVTNQVNVGQGGNVFVPASRTIHVGDTIKFVLVSGIHSVSSNGVASEPFCGNGAMPAFCFVTFNSPGVFPYRCLFHPPGMVGSVTVLPGLPEPPTVAITDPAPNARFTSLPIVVSGTASSTTGVAAVEYQVGANGVFGPTNTASGTTGWTASLNGLPPGTNTIRVQSIDLDGVRSERQERSFCYVVTTPLTLTISGAGTVAGVTNGQPLEIGKGYVLTATPDAGFAFQGWTGGLASTNRVLSFIMSAGLALQASFSIEPTLGFYNGLFLPASGGAATNSGYFSLTLKKNHSFNGKLLLAGGRFNFSGQLDAENEAQVSVPRPGRTPLTMRLEWEGADGIHGTVSDGAWTAELTGDRSGAGLFDGPAPFTGRYTVVIPGAADPAASPGGDGAGSVVVDAAGNMHWTGTLGDGTKIKPTASLSETGEVPLYVSLDHGAGLLLGRLRLDTNPPPYELQGSDVIWSRPARLAAKLYPGGFAESKMVWGLRYTAPAAGASVLNWSNGVVLITGGNVPGVLSNRVLLVHNKITVLDGNSNKLSLTLQRPSGLFSGKFIHPATRQPAKFNGAVLQAAGWGGGWFLGTNQSGSIFLGPEP